MSHDAQHELEQRSLRNVRALLDKLESEAATERRTRKWIGAGLAVCAVLLAGVFYFATKQNKAESRTIVTQPASRAPTPSVAPETPK